MKKGLKKNQVIITSLAILIAAAGYLNFADVDFSIRFDRRKNYTDNGYDALEMLIGYEDSMEFCYYLLNGDKIAFISASTASNDENLYDSLEEYTKEVVNSFKWNK